MNNHTFTFILLLSGSLVIALCIFMLNRIAKSAKKPWLEKIKAIGQVKCNRCGHVGTLHAYGDNVFVKCSLVCEKCGGPDWTPSHPTTS